MQNRLPEDGCPPWRCPAVLLLVLSTAITGCIPLSSNIIVDGRFKYNEAIRDSWEEQMLFNIVSLRYGESTVFMDVDSLITQYGLETRATIGGGINTGDLGSNTVRGAGGAIWTERPTITYAPLEGREFARSMLAPMNPAEIFALISAGWNAERSLRLIVKSVNGLSSSEAGSDDLQPDFLDLLQAFKVMQDEEALGIRQEFADTGVKTYLYVRRGKDKPEIEGATDIFRRSLGLVLESPERAYEADVGIEVIFGPYLGRTDSISLQTYSVMDILVQTAGYIRAPEKHVAEGRTQENLAYESDDPRTRPPIRILSSLEKPEAAVVKLENRGYWFYIDDRDIESKKSFSFLMILLQLQASHEAGKAPVVTIGTGS